LGRRWVVAGEYAANEIRKDFTLSEAPDLDRETCLARSTVVADTLTTAPASRLASPRGRGFFALPSIGGEAVFDGCLLR
jgi:hypothetical protein